MNSRQTNPRPSYRIFNASLLRHEKQILRSAFKSIIARVLMLGAIFASHGTFGEKTYFISFRVFFITNQIFMTVQKRRSRRSVHQCTDFVRGNEMLISIGNYKVLKQLITPFNLRECHLKIFQFLCD